MKAVKMLCAAAALAASSLGTGAQAQTTPSRPDGRAIWMAMDTNKDGVLTREEWLAAGRRERGFQFIDGDRDGKVTPQELKAGVEKFRAMRGGGQPAG